jgi:hypothetical protein
VIDGVWTLSAYGYAGKHQICALMDLEIATETSGDGEDGM